MALQPIHRPIVIYLNSVFNLTVSVEDSDGPVDVGNVYSDVQFRIFTAGMHEAPLIDYTLSGGDLNIADTNTVGFTIPEAELEDINRNRLYYELRFFLGPEPITYMYGAFSIKGPVEGVNVSGGTYGLTLNEEHIDFTVGSSAALAMQAKEDAEAAAQSAQSDATSASNSASDAAQSASSASVSETNAAQSADAASASANDADTSEANASQSATSAADSASSADSSETAAANSASTAQSAASTATSEADRAESEADSIYPTQVTGTQISFDTHKIFNTPTIPAGSGLTQDLSNARTGVVQKIY